MCTPAAAPKPGQRPSCCQEHCVRGGAVHRGAVCVLPSNQQQEEGTCAEPAPRPGCTRTDTLAADAERDAAV